MQGLGRSAPPLVGPTESRCPPPASSHLAPIINIAVMANGERFRKLQRSSARSQDDSPGITYLSQVSISGSKTGM
jgi:hypothetical protein